MSINLEAFEQRMSSIESTIAKTHEMLDDIKETPGKKTRLRKLKIDRVDLCFRGANQDSRVMFYKDERGEIEEEKPMTSVEEISNNFLFLNILLLVCKDIMAAQKAAVYEVAACP